MNSKAATDYTLERAREVYSRDEFTRWLLGWGQSDPQLPSYIINIIAVQGEYVVFTHGYKDQGHHRLAFTPTRSGLIWWKWMLDTVRDYYVKSKFYDS